jgi:Ion channel
VSEPSEPRPRHHHLPALSWGSDLEHAAPGARYGVVLVLLLITFVFMASGPTGDWVALVTVVLQGLTLLAALAASEAGRRAVRFSMAVIAIGLLGSLGVLVEGTTESHGYVSILSLVLVSVGPFAIVESIWRRRVIDIQTVLGAVSIYVFVGMGFAFAYQTVDNLGSNAFFAQQHTATIADFLYFSFVTLTTTGYGDLTAAGGLGRAMAVIEALLGQIYLVTIVALLVSRLASRRRGDSSPDG